MANREALRELQNRLSDRLQAARVQGIGASWLAVEAGGQRLLLPLAQSGEIFPLTPLQRVPYTHEWFVGVANLRGGLFGVVDLAAFLTGQAPVVRGDMARNDARLVALNPALEVNAALLIDRLVGLRSPEGFAEVIAPPAGQPAHLTTVFVETSGARWQELNLQLLAQSTPFLSIGV